MRGKRILVAAVVFSLAVSVTVVGAFAAFFTQVKGSSGVKTATMAFSTQVKDNGPITGTLSKADNQAIGRVTVSNTENGKLCEVNTKYTITLVADQSVPDTVETFLTRENQTYTPSKISKDRKTFEFSSEDFRFGIDAAEERTYEIQLQWPDGPIAPTQTISFKVEAIAEQID